MVHRRRRLTYSDPNERNEVLSASELRELRQSNPEALFRHLTNVRQQFLFGVEDHRVEPEDEPEWGGDLRVLLNRNLMLHLVHGFTEAMPTPDTLPQFCVMPDAARADSTGETVTVLDDGERIRGVVFYVDPEEYDVLARDAVRIAEEYVDWDLIPDSYYLDSELVRFVIRVVLEDATVAAERKYDFRLGLVGGSGPPPLEDDEQLTASDLMLEVPEGGEGNGGEDDDDDDPPLTGMRSHPVEWGGD